MYKYILKELFKSGSHFNMIQGRGQTEAIIYFYLTFFFANKYIQYIDHILGKFRTLVFS